jgi:autotransporter adhesin
VATGSNASAYGFNASATGDNSVAVGQSAVASATGAIAVGSGATASAVNATAIGLGSVASASGATALGQGATAAGLNATAVGQGATAAMAGSTAIGNGAVTTAPNQIMVGTTANTYTMPGVNSAASLAAQSGPTKFITADGGGNVAASAYGPTDIANLQSSVGSLQTSVATLQGDVKRAFEGTAIALAMGGGALPDNKKFALSMNVGTFSGQSGGAVSAQYRLADNVILDAGVGAGFAQGGVGARGGLTVAW